MPMMHALMQMMATAANSPRQGECNLEWAMPKARARPPSLEAMLGGPPSPATADAARVREVVEEAAGAGAAGVEEAAAAEGAEDGDAKDTPRKTAEETTAHLLAALRDRGGPCARLITN